MNDCPLLRYVRVSMRQANGVRESEGREGDDGLGQGGFVRAFRGGYSSTAERAPYQKGIIDASQQQRIKARCCCLTSSIHTAPPLASLRCVDSLHIRERWVFVSVLKCNSITSTSVVRHLFKFSSLSAWKCLMLHGERGREQQGLGNRGWRLRHHESFHTTTATKAIPHIHPPHPHSTSPTTTYTTLHPLVLQKLNSNDLMTSKKEVTSAIQPFFLLEGLSGWL